MKPSFKKFRSVFTHLSEGVGKPKAPPDELLGELFQDVQLRRIYPDGMTFVDLVPAGRMRKIVKAYKEERRDPYFNLHTFVEKYFKEYLHSDYKTNPKHTIEEHINELWDVLTQEHYRSRGSLFALPYPYVVPGGRFKAQWYWDTYFTMLGLAASDRYDLIDGMVKNYAFLIRKFGYIPQANRTYYITRSQPPYFSQMVRLLAEEKGKMVLVKYLPYLRLEYRFWMKGHKELDRKHQVYRRVVRMADGSRLNRYYDNKHTPRPESYKEDVETAHRANDHIASKVYTDLRAAAESGWDFSSRWFKDPQALSTIHTTDLVPVDLNCLLLMLEETIRDTYLFLKQEKLARKYQRRMDRRKAAIDEYCWDKKRGFYFDYDFIAESRTDRYTLAAVYPLFAKAASQEQADAVAKILKEKFLKHGGLVTTLDTTGQQWDAPNGWAPLQWVTIKGLRHYGHDDLADEIKKRWITTCETMYKKRRKLVEKYNVLDSSMSASGGEYELQDGFGWTNGVLMALLREKLPKK